MNNRLFSNSKQNDRAIKTKYSVSISEREIQKHQQSLNQNGFVYIDNLNPEIDWIELSQKTTNTRLMPQDNLEL